MPYIFVSFPSPLMCAPRILRHRRSCGKCESKIFATFRSSIKIRRITSFFEGNDMSKLKVTENRYTNLNSRCETCAIISMHVILFRAYVGEDSFMLKFRFTGFACRIHESKRQMGRGRACECKRRGH